MNNLDSNQLIHNPEMINIAASILHNYKDSFNIQAQGVKSLFISLIKLKVINKNLTPFFQGMLAKIRSASRIPDKYAP